MKEEKVYFVVTGETITNLSRTLWADEGQLDKAFNMLESAFPDMEHGDMFNILVGNKKITGDSKVGCELVKDSTDISPGGNPLSWTSVFGRFKKELDKEKDWVQLLTDQTFNIASTKGLVAIPNRRKKEYEDEELDIEDIPHKKVDVHVPDFGNRKKANCDDADSDSIPNPVAHKSIVSNTGWLSPEGKFYSCPYMGHIELANDLGFDEAQLEKLGWIKIAGNKLYWDSFLETFKPTQAQINVVFDWSQKTGNKIPKGFLDA